MISSLGPQRAGGASVALPAGLRASVALPAGLRASGRREEKEKKRKQERKNQPEWIMTARSHRNSESLLLGIYWKLVTDS
jgi:hypothetical protein